MSNYDHEYCEYDEIGLARIRCQSCGNDVVRRHYVEIPIKSDPPRMEKVLTLVKLGNYARKRLVISDGSFINLYMCKDCDKNESFDYEYDSKKCDKVIKQIKSSFINEDRSSRKHENEVQENAKRWDSLKALKNLREDITIQQAHEEAIRIVESHKEIEHKKALKIK